MDERTPIARLRNPEEWNDPDYLFPITGPYAPEGIPVRKPPRFIELVEVKEPSDEFAYIPANYGGIVPSHAAWQRARDEIERFYEAVTPEYIDEQNWYTIGSDPCRNQRPLRNKHHGFVYVIKARDLYKIGVSRNPERRIRRIESPNGCPLRLLFKVESEDMYELEAALHQRLTDYHVTGEWFRLDSTALGDLVAMLAELEQ